MQQTLSATGASNEESGIAVDISISGTWVGTVKLQREINSTWMDTGDSWTANVETSARGAGPLPWRLHFTRTSGDAVVALIGSLI